MSGSRIGWVIPAVVIGAVAAIVGNWWTVAAMVCVAVGLVAAERRDRRQQQASDEHR
ncbi:hypothetical protein [Sanguibacter sp. 26GB23]|uniref:hypothetical protein n=1 Tax=Sanguibacter sp. 26GB23 TaxID=3156066 RepID=UPI0032AF01EE